MNDFQYCSPNTFPNIFSLKYFQLFKKACLKTTLTC